MMTLLARDGRAKLVPACTYPPTGLGCVTRVYTDLAGQATAVPVMGPADSSHAVPVMGRPDGHVISLMGPGGRG